MSELAVKPVARRGRIWVVLMLSLGLIALGYAIVNISTQKPDLDIVHIEGISEAQEIFGGIPQEGERLGSSDAPVTIQVFNDLQCSSCREAFLTTIPTLAENYARPGSVKLLYRHYSNSETELERGFFGAEAAAEQGYGWQYTYLFFRNQEEIKGAGEARFETFVDSVAGSVEELETGEWEKAREEAEAGEGPIPGRLKSDAELGEDLGIRFGQAMIVSGPNGSRTLQDSPTLAEAEKAIAEVE
ncbi:MAG TPA: thioredoxin domain-containing protein [Solirubrobacterales bacterium]|nr:thioredoxin domain-containing protein [Solirubrobacterales bacterium]